VKRIVFSKIKNIILQGSALSEIILLYTKNQRTVARDLLKNVIFQKFRFALILREFLSYFSSFLHTSWHRQDRL
jgi:hypothetical protein